jgi:hypothetical protein
MFHNVSKGDWRMVGNKATAVFQAIIQDKIKRDGTSLPVRDLAASCGSPSTAPNIQVAINLALIK